MPRPRKVPPQITCALGAAHDPHLTSKWDVRFVDTMPADLPEDFGCTCPESHVVYVKRRSDVRDVLRVLFHEILHIEAPNWSEDAVDRAAIHLTSVVVELGLAKLTPLRPRKS